MSSKIRALQFNARTAQDFANKQMQSFQSTFQPQRTNVIEYPYDRYERANLKLIECFPGDVQVLNRDILLAEGSMSQSLLQQINVQNNQTQKRQTHRQTYGQTYRQTYPQRTRGEQINKVIVSKECRENEAIFNAKAVVEQKAARQKGFLSAMEQKILELQSQAALLSEMQEEEKLQIQQVKLMQAKAEGQLSKETFLKEVNRIADEALQQGNAKQRDIHVYMPKEEINEVLQDHFSKNQQLIDEVFRVTHKGETKMNLKQNKKVVKDKKGRDLKR